MGLYQRDLVFSDLDLDRVAVVGAMRDLERLTGKGAAVALAVVSELKDPIHALVQEFLAADATVDRLEAAGAADAQKKVAFEAWTKLQKQIAKTPATTIRAIAAKLRSVLSETNDEYSDRGFLESALEWAERLAGEARLCPRQISPRTP